MDEPLNDPGPYRDPWQDMGALTPLPDGGDRLASGPRGWTWAAWLVIGVICLALFGSTLFEMRATSKPAPPLGPGVSAPPEDPLGLMLMELQAKYMVGTSSMQPGEALLGAAEASLDVGTIEQRQRFVVLAAELGGLARAAEELAELNDIIADETAKKPTFSLNERQASVQRVLEGLYAPPNRAAPGGDEASNDKDVLLTRVQQLDPADADLLRNELGWFGELALTPAGAPDDAARRAVLAPATRILRLLIGAFAAGGILATIGFIALVIVIVLALTGSIRGGLPASPVHHGIYAETFAVWLLVFFSLQLGVGMASGALGSGALLLTFMMFFVSLLALLWPVARGVPWAQVRRDIGWHLGRTPALEPLMGVAGYVMALPLLAVGIGITVLLVLIQEMLRGTGPTFGPSGGPAHPIVLQAGQGNIAVIVQLLLLAAVAAPVVEETMFRGVLYRSLRDATRRSGFIASVLLSGTISALLFAMIHPQGWVAIPALMSLAYAFALLREWRGTVIPSMIVHGISNFLVMTLLALALSA